MGHLSNRFAPGAPKRILALDGGGVRGLISLGLLEAVERELAKRSVNPEQFVLSDYFDLIAGTSTGSIIAVGLAMGFRVEKLIELYQSSAPSIFPKTQNKGWFKNKYDPAPLEALLAEIVGDIKLESEDLKTGLMICAKRMDSDASWVLTNNSKSKYWDCADGSFFPNRLYSVAMLVRASTAAPTFFAPVEIEIASGETGFKKEPGLFVDGAVSGHNNPALQSVLTATLPSYGFGWPSGADNLLVISIGTGWRRDRRDPAEFLRLSPMKQGIAALQGLINDSAKKDLVTLQAMSEPRRPWLINSEIGTMEGERLVQEPLITFQRYDADLDPGAVIEALNLHNENHKKRDKLIATLRDMAASDPGNLRACLSLGRVAGRNVRPDHFPPRFDAILTSPKHAAH